MSSRRLRLATLTGGGTGTSGVGRRGLDALLLGLLGPLGPLDPLHQRHFWSPRDRPPDGTPGVPVPRERPEHSTKVAQDGCARAPTVLSSTVQCGGVRAGARGRRGVAGTHHRRVDPGPDPRLAILPLRRGAIAQLGERLNGIQKVKGSNPFSSTNTPLTPIPDPSPGPARGSFHPGTGTTRDDERHHDTRRHPQGRARPGRALRPGRDRAALAGALGRAPDVRHGPRGRLAAAVLRADDVPVPVGRPPHRPLVRQDARPTRSRATGGCTATTCSSPSGSTPTACPPRTRRSRTGSTPASGPWRTSTRCAASCGRWARASRGTARSSPASRSSTSGTSGCSCSSSRRASPTAPCRRSTGAPTTARSRASRSRAPTAAAGAVARRSRSASSPSGISARRTTPTSCWTSRASTGPTPSGGCRRTGSGARAAPRSCSRRRPRRTTPVARSCGCSRPGPTRCMAPRSWSSPRSTRSSRS